MIPFVRMLQYWNIVEGAKLIKFVTTNGTDFNCMALYSNGELYGIGYNGSHIMGTSVSSYAEWTLLRTDVENIWCSEYGSTILTFDKKFLYSGYLPPFGGTGSSLAWVDYTSRYTAIIKDTDLLQDMQNGKGAWKLKSTADFLCLLSGISVLNHSESF